MYQNLQSPYTSFTMTDISGIHIFTPYEKAVDTFFDIKKNELSYKQNAAPNTQTHAHTHTHTHTHIGVFGAALKPRKRSSEKNVSKLFLIGNNRGESITFRHPKST